MTDTLETTKPAVSVDVLDRFDQVEAALNSELIRLEREVHGVLVGVVAQLHVLLYGGPGIAKSTLADRLFARISGARYGKWPMHRLMSGDDVFGPVDVAAYAEERRFRRLLTGYLADVEYANLEELFKAGPAALGLLLPALNERKIRDDGVIKTIPLKFVVASSNELPKDELTMPLYDRIPLRFEVKPPEEAGDIQALIELEMVNIDDLTPLLTGEDLAVAQAEAAALPLGAGVAKALTTLYFNLREKGIYPTPRRLVWTVRAMRAEAWLDGSDVVTTDHLSIAAHALWDLPAQAADVQDSVIELANPLERRTLKLIENVGVVRQMLPATIACADEEEKQSRGMEIFQKVTEAGDELEEIIDAAGSSRRQRDVIQSARKAVQEVLEELLTKVMDIPLEDIDTFGLPELPK